MGNLTLVKKKKKGKKEKKGQVRKQTIVREMFSERLKTKKTSYNIKL